MKVKEKEGVLGLGMGGGVRLVFICLQQTGVQITVCSTWDSWDSLWTR